MTTILPRPNADYTDQDYDSFYARIIQLAQSVWPDWTETEDPAKFDNVEAAQTAWIGDALAYLANKNARQSRIPTCTERKAMIALLRSIIYEMAPASAAQADVEFTLASPPLADVTILAGTEVSTRAVAEPVVYQLLADVTIAASADPPIESGTVEHSVTHAQVLPSDGRQWLELTLDRTPFVAIDSVVADQGAFSEIGTFLESDANDLHYSLVVDQNDRARLRFGDGNTGSIPLGNIQVVYCTGGGSEGNVDQNSITVIPGQFTDVEGRPVTVTTTNPTRASGGAPRETIDHAREAGPHNLRAITRSITRDDFEIHATTPNVPGSDRALMLTADLDDAVAENTGILFVVPAGGGTPSQALLDAVELSVTVTFPPPLTFQLAAQAAQYLEIDVEARVVFDDGVDPVAVREAIHDSLELLFVITLEDGTANPAVDFGVNTDGLVAWSDVFNAVRDTEGVDRLGPQDLRINELLADATIALREFPTLGEVVVRNAATGAIV